MKKVYVVKGIIYGDFKFLRAFSTARKAIEHAKWYFQGDEGVTIVENEKHTIEYLKDVPTEKLIRILNKKYWLALNNGESVVEIDVLPVIGI